MKCIFNQCYFIRKILLEFKKQFYFKEVHFSAKHILCKLLVIFDKSLKENFSPFIVLAAGLYLKGTQFDLVLLCFSNFESLMKKIKCQLLQSMQKNLYFQCHNTFCLLHFFLAWSACRICMHFLRSTRFSFFA